jgi:hypothetical protein
MRTIPTLLAAAAMAVGTTVFTVPAAPQAHACTMAEILAPNNAFAGIDGCPGVGGQAPAAKPAPAPAPAPPPQAVADHPLPPPPAAAPDHPLPPPPAVAPATGNPYQTLMPEMKDLLAGQPPAPAPAAPAPPAPTGPKDCPNCTPLQQGELGVIHNTPNILNNGGAFNNPPPPAAPPCDTCDGTSAATPVVPDAPPPAPVPDAPAPAAPAPPAPAPDDGSGYIQYGPSPVTSGDSPDPAPAPPAPVYVPPPSAPTDSGG